MLGILVFITYPIWIIPIIIFAKKRADRETEEWIYRRRR